MNSKLFCYGVTPRALQLLLGTNELPKTIPNAWFNWLNQNLGAVGIERITLLDPSRDAEDVLKWNHNAEKAGYGCVLVYATDDPRKHTDHAEGLSDDVVIHPISHIPIKDEIEEYTEVLALLREPDDFFIKGWSHISYGGGQHCRTWTRPCPVVTLDGLR
jgi:hypothetical protein